MWRKTLTAGFTLVVVLKMSNLFGMLMRSLANKMISKIFSSRSGLTGDRSAIFLSRMDLMPKMTLKMSLRRSTRSLMQMARSPTQRRDLKIKSEVRDKHFLKKLQTERLNQRDGTSFTAFLCSSQDLLCCLQLSLLVFSSI